MTREAEIQEIYKNNQEPWGFYDSIGALVELKPDPEKLFFEGETGTQLTWSDYHKTVTVSGEPLDYDMEKKSMPLTDMEGNWTPCRMANSEETKVLMKDKKWVNDELKRLGVFVKKVHEQN